MLKKIQRIVNVDDFGGDPTGQKDSTKAFQDALGTGNVLVTMSAGTYLTTGIKMPNNSRLVGQVKTSPLLNLWIVHQLRTLVSLT